MVISSLKQIRPMPRDAKNGDIPFLGSQNTVSSIQNQIRYITVADPP